MAMLQVKDLIEMLQKYNPNGVVVTQHNQEFVHISNIGNDVIMSTSKPIGYCNRCGELVFPSEVEGYVASCPKHNEDLFSIEFTPLPE